MPVTYELAVDAVRDETPLDRTVTFHAPDAHRAEFSFVPGQFLTLSDPEALPSHRRAYSLSSSPTDPALEVTVREMGAFGSLLYRAPVGRRFTVVPPRGRFTLDVGGTSPMLLLAGGSGVTPYRSFLRYLAATGASRPATLAYSARSPDQLIFHAEFLALAARHAWFRYEPAVTRLAAEEPFAGHRGRLDLEFLRARCDATSTVVYACGPTAFVDGMLTIARTLGVPPDRTRKEVWG